jgi:hypothetical protein
VNSRPLWIKFELQVGLSYVTTPDFKKQDQTKQKQCKTKQNKKNQFAASSSHIHFLLLRAEIKKKKKSGGSWWFKACPRQIVHQTLSLKYPIQKNIWSDSSALSCLESMRY